MNLVDNNNEPVIDSSNNTKRFACRWAVENEN
jgi:hypothetical protein